MTVRAAIATFSLVAIVAVATTALADPPPLPPEAYSACSAKASGDTCSVTIHDRTLAGTCAAHPADARLFCRLERPPAHPTDAAIGRTRGPDARRE